MAEAFPEGVDRRASGALSLHDRQCLEEWAELVRVAERAVKRAACASIAAQFERVGFEERRGEHAQGLIVVAVLPGVRGRKLEE